jgi:uncharacterized protein YprB with RNaseH-like and TPR domain
VTKAKKEPRILLWDIETDGINADRILCIGYKFAGGKTHLLKATDYPRAGLWDDSGLIAAFAEVFASCDYHVTWYGARFDLPVVNARIIANGLQPLPPKPHVDLWKTARYQFRTGGGNRLAKWQDFLGLPAEKTPVRPSVWIKARYGHEPSLRYIYEHCIKDVGVLEDVYSKLRPWVSEEPARGLMVPTARGTCISCGSLHLVARGWRVSRTRRYQQYQCKNCGKWQAEKKADLIKGEFKP